MYHRSIVNLTSTSSSFSSHLPTFVDPSHPESSCPPSPSPTSDLPASTPPSSDLARLLRRTARSNLVNIYRRHVIPELTRRFPKEGGFCVWILHSMRRRAWEKMEDLVQEGVRLQQQALELHQCHEHEQEPYTQYQQERVESPIPMDKDPFRPRFIPEETGSSAITMTVPFSFDEGGSTGNEDKFAKLSRNNSEEDDLETIPHSSSLRTRSSTPHIGPGFMGGSGSSPTSSITTQPLPLPPKISLFSSQPCLPSHILLEYNVLSRQHQRLCSLILFADSQIRVAEDDKLNRDEILLVRGRRRAWLNGELARAVDSTATGTSSGMQWGFAAPFKSSPLARYSWSASAELDEVSEASTNYTGVCPQQQPVDEDEEEYDEFHGLPAVRNPLIYTHGRQSRRSRYSNEAKKLPPVTEEIECENPTLDVNPNGSVYHSFHHRGDSSFLDLDQVDEDVSDEFSLEDPRELDLELGFGLHDPISVIGEDGKLLGDVDCPKQVEGEEKYDQRERRSDEISRIAFEMERPKILPRVRDGSRDEDSIPMMAVGTSSSNNSLTSTRSGGGLLSWGYWGVGKNSGGKSDGRRVDGTVGRSRSWKNGIGIGLGSVGRSLNKARQGELEEELSRQRQPRVSTSSTASTASSSSTKSQKQQQQQRELPQVELEPKLHQNQDQDHSLTTPLLCQPVSFSVSHILPEQADISTLPRPATPTSSPPTRVAMLPPTSPKDATQNPKDTTCSTSVPANSVKTSFVSTAPFFFTAKKLSMASPNVYADIDVSVVHVGEDNKTLNPGFGVGQTVNPGAVSHTTGMQAPVYAPRLRPRRHKREYQYPRQQQRYQHVYGNEVSDDRDECDEFELSGYGQFSGGPTPDSHLLYPDSKPKLQQQKHKSMIHARLHLDELLLEEGLLFNNHGCHDVTDQEEFTLAMDVPLSGSGGRRNLKALKKMQYLQLHQNRDFASQQQPQLGHQRQVRLSVPASSQVVMNGLGEEGRETC